MSEELSVPDNFEGVTRLFPLPNVVLFPGVLLPLHIFEPRYRQMTADALASDQLISMVLLKPGWDQEPEIRPAVCSVACLGKIVADQRLADGRYNILLRGLHRARVVQELDSDKLYRSARVELLEGRQEPPVDDPQLRRLLHEGVSCWLSAMGVAPDQIAKLLEGERSLNSLVDVVGFALPIDMNFKQQLLEDVDVESRVRRIITYLGENEPPTADKENDRHFPPDFSIN